LGEGEAQEGDGGGEDSEETHFEWIAGE